MAILLRPALLSCAVAATLTLVGILAGTLRGADPRTGVGIDVLATSGRQHMPPCSNRILEYESLLVAWSFVPCAECAVCQECRDVYKGCMKGCSYGCPDFILERQCEGVCNSCCLDVYNACMEDNCPVPVPTAVPATPEITPESTTEATNKATLEPSTLPLHSPEIAIVNAD